MSFTPSELSLWISTPEHLDALCTLLESGDLRLVDYPGGGSTVLKTHTRSLTRLEIGIAPILPESTD
jgi:hypothetical protein